ncbi:AGC/PKA protein kinase Pka1 [Schizosaccharomyces japonicus yFS275]|uniref:cAMP-dependent protein kinase n=1 Tax=Schizosaccharomyces japonicus (strain yFS275 / FY16936) TaxID=402676 RepID=B6K6I0_SCHJY|nr:AGC/PKA protein kinase Pka1 [Schizosaccharomyces japonicus yFS275]EEB09134.1 AGC/PKA protein kinase Pka1 [Schizosaccharomyces japonicus yFS275]
MEVKYMSANSGIREQQPFEEGRTQKKYEMAPHAWNEDTVPNRTDTEEGRFNEKNDELVITPEELEKQRQREIRGARIMPLLDLQRKRIRPQTHQTKGRYNMEDFSFSRTLGTGSFGRVHLVQSKHNHLFYAIKVLEKRKVVEMKQVEHSCDERQILSRVQHPFITILWGTFQDARNLFMVMDFVEGGELFSLLRKCHRFPERVARFYAAEVILALDYLHHNQIVYRDLKPENLLLDRGGHVKIVDFGFAKNVSQGNCFTLCGTPDYLAPEIISLKPYNKAVDWWSLGILLFEMLAGYPPFYSNNPMKLYENILESTVKYPSHFSPLATDLISRLLQRDLSKRYGNLKNGSLDIILHPWFEDINWESILTRKVEVPYVPPIRAGTGDSSQFEVYADAPLDYGDNTSPQFTELFQDF